MLIETVVTLLVSGATIESTHSLLLRPAIALAEIAVGTPQKDSDKDEEKAAKSSNKSKKKAKDPSKPKKTKAEKAAAKAAKAAAKAAKLAPDQSDSGVSDDGSDGSGAQIDTGKRGLATEWKQHPSIRLGSAGRIEFQAKFQEDARESDAGATNLERWEMHRNRIGIKGKLFKHIEFEVERELTETELTERDVLLGLGATSPWKDVNVEFTYFNNAQVQIGKFKIPFGLDQLTGVTHNDFVYRSLGANYLSPARDIGGMVHGRFFKRRLNYWTGVFLHDGDNARSKKIEGGDQTFALRLSTVPFQREAMRGLEIGSAYTISKLSDDSFRPNGLRGRTVLTQDTFYEPVYVKGARRRWEGDVEFIRGRFGARSEYTWVSDDRLGQGIGDQDLPDARAQAWYVSGTWVVTGEAKERPLKPDGDLFQSGVGAVELAGRYERLWYDSVGGSLADASRTPRTEVILPESEHALTLGVNWTLNRFIKLQFNAIREKVDDPDRSPVPGGGAFWNKVFRLQLVL